MILGVMDNFNYEDNTLSGIGDSHHTILMLFQNGNDALVDVTVQIIQIPNSLFRKKQSLDHIIDCQKIIKSGTFSERGHISITFQLSHRIDYTFTIDTSSTQYKT